MSQKTWTQEKIDKNEQRLWDDGRRERKGVLTLN
jgi:hypothetical protein